MKSKLIKRKWLSIATLALIISVYCSGGIISAKAYDDVFASKLKGVKYFDSQNSNLFYTTSLENDANYGFTMYNYNSKSTYSDVRRIEVLFAQDFLPLITEAYDYYLYTTFYSYVEVSNFSFCPDKISLFSEVCDGDYSVPCEDVKVFHHDGYNHTTYTGFSAVAKVPETLNSSSLRAIYLHDSNGGILPADKMYFRVSFFAVPKGSSPEGVFDSIEDHLQSIEDSADSMVDKLQVIEDAMDELINGFSGLPLDQVTNAFWDSSDELKSYEQDLMNQSSDSVNSYMSDSFNLSVLDTLGSSLTFVVTWFTNFWNMGGVFTDTLNLLFALSIVFYIIKVR